MHVLFKLIISLYSTISFPHSIKDIFELQIILPFGEGYVFFPFSADSLITYPSFWLYHSNPIPS